MPALVIGNGESRKTVDLNLLKKKYTTIGCNALHRDFFVDHLVCCDRRMVAEALTNPYIENIYTRERYWHDFKKLQKEKRVHLLPTLPYKGTDRVDDPVHWGSGPYALLLATSLNFNKISMLGFDLYGVNDKVNNCYKGTTNYSNPQSAAVDPSYWLYQIKKVFELNQNKKFIIYNNRDWKLPKEWTYSNVSFLPVEELTN